jgi:TPR repeat protein
MYELANLIFSGKGTLQDSPQAVHWYEKAAAKNSANAMIALAHIYKFGLGGISKNSTKAVHWYEAAADSALYNAEAHSAIGLAYLYGDGLSQNDIKAKAHLAMAAELGDSNAQYGMALLAHKRGSKKESVSWLRKSAKNGNADAIYALGLKYYYGDSEVSKNYQEAAYWLLPLADRNRDVRNNPQIATLDFVVSEMYLLGLGGVHKNTSEGYRWLKRVELNGKVLLASTAAAQREIQKILKGTKL